MHDLYEDPSDFGEMPTRPVVIKYTLTYEQTELIYKNLPLDVGEIYYQGCPGPEPKFTDNGMDGLETVVELHVFAPDNDDEQFQIKNQFNVWWRRAFHDEWKLLF